MPNAIVILPVPKTYLITSLMKFSFLKEISFESCL